MRIGIAIVGILSMGLAASALADWPQFRGPHGDGTADAMQLPTRWGVFDPPTWQAEVPGRGWSSPVVVGDRIWLTSAEQTALPTSAAERKLGEGLYRDFAEQFQAHASVTLLAVEFELTTGKRLRQLELFSVTDPPPIHATNTYASPTPVTDGERLFCHFGSLGTSAIELKTGRVLWKRQFAVDDITGPGSSPVLWNDLLVLPVDGVDAQYVVALDKRTGELAWRTERPPIKAEGKHRRAFSTPLIVTFQGREQLIAAGAQWAVAYEPANGNELWRVNFGDGHATVPRPVYRDGLVYICTGFMKPQLWAVRVDGAGDVTESHVAWKHEKQVPEISSPILVGSEIYFVSSLGVLNCLDAKSGEQLWQHRLGGNFAASPIATRNALYFTSQEGVTTVIRPGRSYEELGRSELFGQTMASPAVAGNRLLLRVDRTLHCIGK